MIHGKDDQLLRVNAKAFVVVVRLGLRSFEGTGSRDGGGWVESGDGGVDDEALAVSREGDGNIGSGIDDGVRSDQSRLSVSELDH